MTLDKDCCIIWLLSLGEREVSKGIWIGKVGKLNLNLPSKVVENSFSLSERVVEKYRCTGRYEVGEIEPQRQQEQAEDRRKCTIRKQTILLVRLCHRFPVWDSDESNEGIARGKI